MKLPIAYYGAAVLRKKTEQVKEVNDEIRQLIKDMDETMRANNGMGLAAPQVSRSLALFIICPPVPNPPGHAEAYRYEKIQVFINPKISEPSDAMIDMDEGCVSIPGVRGNVIRPLSVTVEALDENGKPFKKVFTGMEARIIMHENDHINGVLFIDRLQDPPYRKKIEPMLREIKKKYSE
jgi:peptide deformylase